MQTCYPEEMNIIMHVKYPNKCQKSIPKWRTLLSYLSQDYWFSARCHFNTTFYSHSLTGDIEQCLKKFLIVTIDVEVQLEASRQKLGICLNILLCREYASFYNKELSRMSVLPTLRNLAIEHPQAADNASSNSDH